VELVALDADRLDAHRSTSTARSSARPRRSPRGRELVALDAPLGQGWPHRLDGAEGGVLVGAVVGKFERDWE
jgi:hypothetical protein